MIGILISLGYLIIMGITIAVLMKIMSPIDDSDFPTLGFISFFWPLIIVAVIIVGIPFITANIVLYFIDKNKTNNFIKQILDKWFS